MWTRILKQILPKLIPTLILQSVALFHCSESVGKIVGYGFYLFLYVLCVIALSGLDMALEEQWVEIKADFWLITFKSVDWFCTMLGILINGYVYYRIGLEKQLLNDSNFWIGWSLVVVLAILLEILIKIFKNVRKKN